MTTTQKPTPDAVEALSDSLIDIDMCDLDGADYGTNALLAALKEKGFTITRQPAMSDAELEREANELSFLTRDFKCVVGIDDAIALAKKYRG